MSTHMGEQLINLIINNLFETTVLIAFLGYLGIKAKGHFAEKVNSDTQETQLRINFYTDLSAKFSELNSKIVGLERETRECRDREFDHLKEIEKLHGKLRDLRRQLALPDRRELSDPDTDPR